MSARVSIIPRLLMTLVFVPIGYCEADNVDFDIRWATKVAEVFSNCDTPFCFVFLPAANTPPCMQQVQVSIRRIQYEKAWSKVEDMQAEDVVFEGPIIAVNRGGAIVLVEVRRT